MNKQGLYTNSQLQFLFLLIGTHTLVVLQATTLLLHLGLSAM